MAKKKKYYVVWVGVNPGVYDSWNDCKAQIQGFPNAKYKSFTSKAAAEEAYNESFQDHFVKGQSKAKPMLSELSEAERAKIVWDSIAVDAACSGNPGVMEYQGVDTRNGTQIFHKKFELGTNNIGEFLALVHALAMFHQQKKSTPIYTDSATAMAWVRNKKVKTNLKRTAKTQFLYQLIERAEKWLKTHSFDNPILKWDTVNWGEIPADFGRK